MWRGVTERGGSQEKRSRLSERPRGVSDAGALREGDQGGSSLKTPALRLPACLPAFCPGIVAILRAGILGQEACKPMYSQKEHVSLHKVMLISPPTIQRMWSL